MSERKYNLALNSDELTALVDLASYEYWTDGRPLELSVAKKAALDSICEIMRTEIQRSTREHWDKEKPF